MKGIARLLVSNFEKKKKKLICKYQYTNQKKGIISLRRNKVPEICGWDANRRVPALYRYPFSWIWILFSTFLKFKKGEKGKGKRVLISELDYGLRLLCSFFFVVVVGGL